MLNFKSTISVLNTSVWEGCCNDMVRRKTLLRLTDLVECGTYGYNTLLAPLENMSWKEGRSRYCLRYFSLVGIIASVVIQISFQNHIWNHWNLIRKWIARVCNWGSLGSMPTCCPLCVRKDHTYHCAPNIYLLQIFIKIKFSVSAEMCIWVTGEDLIYVVSLVEDHQDIKSCP